MSEQDFTNQIDALSLPWKLVEDKLVVNLKVKDFGEALGKVTQIGQVAEELNHHPDISLHDYNEITVTTTTHDKGKVTEKDIELAERVDEILAR